MPRRFTVLLLLTALAAGCGRGDRSELAAVAGTVTFDGKPLESGKVIFESRGARPAVGTIENGRIVEVTTYEPGDGAPVGSHAVTIQSVAAVGMGGSGAKPADFKGDPAMLMRTQSLIPDRYGDPAKSGLKAEVASGEENVFEFALAKE